MSTNDEQNGNNEDVNDNEDDDDDDTGITILVNDLKPTNGTESNETGITILVNDEIPTNPEPAQKLDNERPGLHMFRKLKTCLDSTRLLIGSLRREKGRLMKREMSVECRLSEIEDYKTHMKQDLVCTVWTLKHSNKPINYACLLRYIDRVHGLSYTRTGTFLFCFSLSQVSYLSLQLYCRACLTMYQFSNHARNTFCNRTKKMS